MPEAVGTCERHECPFEDEFTDPMTLEELLVYEVMES